MVRGLGQMIRKKKHWMTKIITGISISMILFLAGCGAEEKEPVVEEDEDVMEENLDEDIYPNFSEIEQEDTVYTYQVAYSIQKDEEWYVKIRVFQNREEMEELVINKSDCEGVWLEKDELIEEADVDFDGNKDILIRMGEKYRCYLYREGEFKYCEGFEEIREPEVYEAQHLLISKAEKDDEKFRLDRYEVIDDTVQKVDSVELDIFYEYYDEVLCDIIFNRKQTDWRTAYQYIVNSYEKSEFNCTYNLININDDMVPELLVEINNCAVSAYSFYEEEITILMHQWAYGVGGNYGYEYIERENLLLNFNQDYAGHVRNYNLYEMTEMGELGIKCSLKMSYEDDMGNIISPGDENEGNWKYYYEADDSGYIQVTEEEFEIYASDLEKEYIYLQGKVDQDGIMDILLLKK